MVIGVVTGPLSFAGVLLATTLWLSGWTGGSAIVTAAVLCLVPVVFGVGVLTLQRWSASGQTVASCGLLAACLIAVFILSAPNYLSVVAGSADKTLASDAVIATLAELIAFVGIVVAVVMTPIVIVEILLRWVSGSVVPVSEGPFLVMRWVGTLLVISCGSVLIQEEGVDRLLHIFQSMRM
jgi:hypothetical protein